MQLATLGAERNICVDLDCERVWPGLILIRYTWRGLLPAVDASDVRQDANFLASGILPRLHFGIDAFASSS